jgi:hypothetical protein
LHVTVQREDARRAVEEARAWIRWHRCGTSAIGCDVQDSRLANWRQRSGRQRQW